MTRRIQQSVREDYNGLHRTSGGFLRRQCLLASLAGDRELAAEITEHIRSLIDDWKKRGTHFFDNGHHCAGYVEQGDVVNSLPLFMRED